MLLIVMIYQYVVNLSRVLRDNNLAVKSIYFTYFIDHLRSGLSVVAEFVRLNHRSTTVGLFIEHFSGERTSVIHSHFCRIEFFCRVSKQKEEFAVWGICIVQIRSVLCRTPHFMMTMLRGFKKRRSGRYWRKLIACDVSNFGHVTSGNAKSRSLRRQCQVNKIVRC